jgi:hypothetical protein
MRNRAYAATAALAMGLLANGVHADHIRLDPARFPHIVNGVDTHAYPTAGALLYSRGGTITLDNASSWCSGTLIGCETFLVAAHCVDDPDPSHYFVYLQHAGLVPVAAISRHASFTDEDFPRFDAGVVKLADWVTGIAPTAVNQTDPTPFIGAAGTIVGFGQSEGDANDYGIKRVGAVETSACPLDLADADVLCWDFLAPIGPPGTDSNTCNGDSGGPLFLDLGSGPVVAGITSGGSTLDCLSDDTGYDADVYIHRAYILGELGADSVSTCGGLPPVGDAQTTVIGYAGDLDAGTPTESHTVTVPSGANALRVALNGEDNGTFDVDLYLEHGAGAGPSSFDCAATGETVFGGCTIDLPAAGDWSIAVARAAGAGTYQVTATIFGGAAPVCGNGTREFNETCDGSDDELCPGQCNPSCQCPVLCAPDDLTDVKARINANKLRLRGRVQNADGAFTGADPRDGITLTLMQGATAVTVAIPPGDPGWAFSDPARGRYKWTGDIGGVTRIKAIDRTERKGIWKLVVVGNAVPGGGALNLDLPVQATLTLDGICTTTTF